MCEQKRKYYGKCGYYNKKILSHGITFSSVFGSSAGLGRRVWKLMRPRLNLKKFLRSWICRQARARKTNNAALKRRIAALEQLVGRLSKGTAKKLPGAATDHPTSAFRFSASGLLAQRKRLGLSASEAARLLEVSDQSVYKWENGKTRPRASQFALISALRGMSKKEAASRLATSTS